MFSSTVSSSYITSCEESQVGWRVEARMGRVAVWARMGLLAPVTSPPGARSPWTRSTRPGRPPSCHSPAASPEVSVDQPRRKPGPRTIGSIRSQASTPSLALVPDFSPWWPRWWRHNEHGHGAAWGARSCLPLHTPSNTTPKQHHHQNQSPNPQHDAQENTHTLHPLPCMGWLELPGLRVGEQLLKIFGFSMLPCFYTTTNKPKAMPLLYS